MSDIDDNMLEDFEEEPIAPASKPAAPANRNFFIAIAVIGALFLLSLIGLAVYGAVVLPQQSAARREQAAAINAQNTATALAATQLAGQVVIVPSVTPAPTDTGSGRLLLQHLSWSSRLQPKSPPIHPNHCQPKW
jgi:hypothetical protein